MPALMVRWSAVLVVSISLRIARRALCSDCRARGLGRVHDGLSVPLLPGGGTFIYFQF